MDGRPARPRRVLVTGAAGFVGVNVARALGVRGHRVVAFDHRGPDAAARSFAGEAVWLSGDVRDREPLEAGLRTHAVDTVVHAAAVTATTPEWEHDRARDVLAVNILGTVAALEAAHAADVRRVVVVSSTSALGSGYQDGQPIPEEAPAAPADLYGISKLAMEGVARRLGALCGLEVAAVRLAQPYGPMERPSPDRAALSPVADWMAAAAAGRPLTTPSLAIAKDWTYVEDTAAGFVCLVEAEARLRHAVYNLGSGTTVTVGEVLDAIAAAWPGTRVRVTPDAAHNPNLDPTRTRGPLSVVRLQEELGFHPRFDIRSGIAAYAAWLRAEGRAP
jgi:nucleoside-diphosphate-sugar epimerase